MDTSTNVDPRDRMGGNNPPATIADDLADRFKEHLDRYAELIEAGKAAPETIEDDATHLKVVELAKDMRKLELALDNNRDLEKAPWQTKVEEVNGWFKSRIAPLETLRKTLQERHKQYSERKAAEEKRRIEEEAERKRAREREALRLAAEAEATRIASEQAAHDARRLADDAKLQRDAATTEVEAAASDAAQAAAEASAIWAKMLAIDADHARRRKDGEAITPEMIAASKGDLPEQLKAAKEKQQTAEATLKEKREAAREAKRKKDDADRLAAEQERAANTARREEKGHVDTAIREDKAATRLEQRAGGPPSDLARVRSEHGAVGTLQRKWESRVVDLNLLDKNALWPFIHPDAISSALWKWMMAQPVDKRKMAGAEIGEDTVGAIR